MRKDTDNVGAQELLRKTLVGKKLASLELIAPGVWDFRFDEIHVNAGSPWRILDAQGVRLGSCDHLQKFGLPEPVDAARRALEILRDVLVEGVAVTPLSSDLQLKFQGEFLLDIFNHSSGYEGWNVSRAEGQVIALGGGELAIWSQAP